MNALFPSLNQIFRFERKHIVALTHHQVKNGVKLIARKSPERAGVILGFKFLVVRPVVRGNGIISENTRDFDFEFVRFFSDF